MIHGMISVLVAAVLAALLATQGAAAQAILLEGARVVAGDGSPPIENAALLVEIGCSTLRVGYGGHPAPHRLRPASVRKLRLRTRLPRIPGATSDRSGARHGNRARRP